jgi:hypothetical protein
MEREKTVNQPERSHEYIEEIDNTKRKYGVGLEMGTRCYVLRAILGSTGFSFLFVPINFNIHPSAEAFELDGHDKSSAHREQVIVTK